MLSCMTVRYYPVNRTDFELRYNSEAKCYAAIAQLRLRKDMTCPKCGSVAGGTRVMVTIHARDGDWKKETWQCRKCRNWTSALRDTIFAGNKIPLQTWFRLLWWVAASKEPTSSYRALSPELKTEYGVELGGQATAWAVLHRLRCALMPKAKLSGAVQLGVTHVDHLYSRRGRTDLYAVIAATQEPYRAILASLPALDPDSITNFALQHIAPGSNVVTGQASCFAGLAAAGFNHSKNEPEISDDPLWKPSLVTGLAEHLDECLKKAHHAQVSESNLPEYFAEFAFRHIYAYKTVGRRFYTLLQTVLR
jgi:hypothetical protein